MHILATAARTLTHPVVPIGGKEVLSMAPDERDLWNPPPVGALGTAVNDGRGPSESGPEGEEVRGSRRGAEIGLGG